MVTLKKPAPTKHVETLLAAADAQLQVIANAQAARRDYLTQVSKSCCPYKEGQVLMHSAGLGVNGLLVNEIVAVEEIRNPGNANRWAVQTWALSKTGEVTKRSVYVDEGHGFEITIRE